jgi:L-alanine-DL-glutamate epimerase-like enolase superfamily enzyme
LNTAAAATRKPAEQKASDVRVQGVELYFLPVQTRAPLKFGPETLTSVTCARVRMTVTDRAGRIADGWGETPLSVQWAWPGALRHSLRQEAMQRFCQSLGRAWVEFPERGHALEVGEAFLRTQLPGLREHADKQLPGGETFPLLAALVCSSAFDIALHDAYGNLLGLPTYETYGAAHLNKDLSCYLVPATDASLTFVDKYPADFLTPRKDSLPVWHLVGGLDALTPEEAQGNGPDDGHPHYLNDWIERDGLTCLKVKLRGTDFEWDFHRVVQVGRIALRRGVERLTADFNCTVANPAYVTRMLDRWQGEAPEIYDALLYVEQPFPYDMIAHPIKVQEISARKPLLMDESADSWVHIRHGRELGWNGVALKTCKTQTGALLSLCWAQAHGMHLMVQDLTNPMLAQIPHVLLAAHADTMMGVESNAMQFYPDASAPEAAVHPGLYQRRAGRLNLSSLRGSGFGYRLDEIARQLPKPAASFRTS